MPNFTFIGATCCPCRAKNLFLDYWVKTIPAWLRFAQACRYATETLEVLPLEKKWYCDSVVLATTEGEIEGKCFPGRRRMSWTMFGGRQAWREQSNGKKIRLLVAGRLRVVRPTAYEQQHRRLRGCMMSECGAKRSAGGFSHEDAHWPASMTTPHITAFPPPSTVCYPYHTTSSIYAPFTLRVI